MDKFIDILIDIIISIIFTATSYCILSLYAFYERGYKAYGGECLAAVAIGFFCFWYLRGYIKRK